MADQDEIRGNSVYQIEEPIAETPSPVEKPVAVQQEKKSGLMAKLVSPYPILYVFHQRRTRQNTNTPHRIGRIFNQDVRGEIPAYKDIEIHTWDGPDDPENPFNWSIRYKWLLTITVCFM